MAMTMLEARELAQRVRTVLRNVEVERYKAAQSGKHWAYRVMGGRPGAEVVYRFYSPEQYQRWLEERGR